MAHIIKDMVRETATITGATDPYALAGALTGYIDFDTVMANSDTCWYRATNGTDFEVGLGTFTAGSPDQLARTTILASSNSNNAVVWGSSATVDILMTVVSSGMVTNSAQAPTSAEQRQVRANIIAAPADAGHSLGLMCNPFMEVSQENGTTDMTAIGTTATYAADNSFAQESSDAVASTRNIVTPFSGTANFKRLMNSVRTIVTTADASLSAAQYVRPNQFAIEGVDLGFLGWAGGDRRDIVVVGVVMALEAGAYPLAIQNGAKDRTYVRSVTLAAATPTVIYEVIPADTGGTWETTATAGMRVTFGFAGGSDYQSSALDTWAAGDKPTHASMKNWEATTNGYVQVAYLNVFPVGVLPWTSASQITGEALQRLLGARRSYDETLRKCQRYYQLLGLTIVNASSSDYLQAFLGTPMRATPSFSGGGAGFGFGGFSNGVTAGYWYQNVRSTQTLTALARL